MTLVITPGLAAKNYWRDIWRYRELMYFLAWRDIKVRYKQTALGVIWAILQPLVPMVMFSVIFGRIAKLPSEGIPYPLFALTGLLPWQLFATALSSASNSLVGSGGLVTKVYFPRIIIPVAAVCAALVDFFVSFLLVCLLLAWYGITPGAGVVVARADRQVLLLWRHRFITGSWGWEVPLGRIEDGESPAEAAAREFEEETGWRAGPLRHLISVHPTPGISDSAHHVYRADEATHLGSPADAFESERIAWVPLDQVPDLIGRGEIVSATTASALLYLLAAG